MSDLTKDNKSCPTHVDVAAVLVRQLGVLQRDLWPTNSVKVGDVSGDSLAESGVGHEVVNVPATCSSQNARTIIPAT